MKPYQFWPFGQADQKLFGGIESTNLLSFFHNDDRWKGVSGVTLTKHSTVVPMIQITKPA